MKTLEQILDSVRRWHADDCVGNVTLFRAPRSQNMDMIGEQTIKLREMDEEVKTAVRKVFSLLDAEKIEMFRDKDGYPDRVKVMRRF